MTDIDEVPWGEVENLIAKYGGEGHIADRIKTWRAARGWTLKDLGDRVRLSASSIYKIENPAASGGRRRNLTVAEALQFAHVFDKRLAEILLPDLALLEIEGWQRFKAAAEALNEARHHWAVYVDELAHARAAAAGNSGFVERVNAYLAVAEQQRCEQIGIVWVNDGEDERDSRIRERMIAESPGRLPAEVDAAYLPTPAIVAARAVLSADEDLSPLLGVLTSTKGAD